MFWLDNFLLVIEVEEISGKNVHRTDCKMHLSRIDQIEIDEFKKCRTQWRRIVVTGRGSGSGGTEPGIEIMRLEEAWLPHRGRQE